jgi:hypothetical protein
VTVAPKGFIVFGFVYFDEPALIVYWYIVWIPIAKPAIFCIVDFSFHFASFTSRVPNIAVGLPLMRYFGDTNGNLCE